MPRSLPRLVLLFIVVVLVAVACGDDGDDAGLPSDESVESTTTTTSPTPTTDDVEAGDETTTTVAVTTTTGVATGPTGELTGGTLTTREGTTATWSLTATDSSLCFEVGLTNPDPALAESIGDGVASCLEPPRGLDVLESGLSVDVGTADGEKTIGFLWGRVAPEVISLTIEHTDGSQTPIDILDGPTAVGVFAYVVEIETIPPVQDLDAVSGTQIEGSEAIRGFLRSGPTYPTAEPAPVTTLPEYPVS